MEKNKKITQEEIHLLISISILIIVVAVLIFSNSIKKDTSSISNMLNEFDFSKVLLG